LADGFFTMLSAAVAASTHKMQQREADANSAAVERTRIIQRLRCDDNMT
jgi:hypothetical protein